MKIKHLVPELIENDAAIIASFGNARLMKTSVGTCELVGGSQEDRALAGEWLSLFMHEVVLATYPVAKIKLSAQSSTGFSESQRAKGSVALSPLRLLE
jgi:hypothetical protein